MLKPYRRLKRNIDVGLDTEKAKANMEKEIAQNAKSNPKIFWKYANSKRKTNTGISELKSKKNDNR